MLCAETPEVPSPRRLRALVDPGKGIGKRMPTCPRKPFLTV